MIIKRNLLDEIEKLSDAKEAIVITGMRRVGKTTLLKMIYERIESDNKLFLDLENPLNQKYFSNENYDSIPDSLNELGIDPEKRAFVFLDEIQTMPNLPSVVKYLIDHYHIKFYLSGSASFYIKNLFTESLAGRKYIFELFPLTFAEFLQAKHKRPPLVKDVIHESTFLDYDRYLEEYLRYGGFPGVVVESDYQEKAKKIEDIFSSYWSMEVEKLSDFRKKEKVRDLIFLLMKRTGSRLDISKLAKELGINNETVNSYLAFFRDTYLLSTVAPFSTNLDVEIRGQKKIYFIDPGIINHFAQVSDGQLFENTCFNLLRHHGQVQYYQRKSGQEIDFILDQKRAYEVKLSGQEQDLKKLKNLSSRIGIKDSKIISRKYLANPGITYAFLL